MEEKDSSPKKATCYGCLIMTDEKILHIYNVRNEALKKVFQMANITFCSSCYQRAEQAELFIESVQRNQTELHKFVNKNARIPSSTSNCQSQGLKKLTEVHLQPMELTGHESNAQEPFLVYQNKYCIQTEDIKVKLEIEEEKGELLHNFHYEYVADDTTDLSQSVKEEEDDEDEFPLKMLKEKVEIAGIINNCLKKSTKNGKIKKKSKFKTRRTRREIALQCETIPITREECMEERVKMAADENYLNSEYKCTDCLKGFTFKAGLEKHREKHDPSAGDFECDICKQRYNSEDKLNTHKQYHSFRYRCLECNLVRNTRFTIREHYATMHSNDTLLQVTCTHCAKVFKSKKRLRKHQAYKHFPKEKAQCEHCNKVFSTKKSLAIHIRGRHSSVVKRHVCEECGMAFLTPSQLKYHSTKHTDKRDYYCVECDKSFKTKHILQHHLNTAMPHVNYVELPYPCQHCDKRFAIRRDVERHTNRIHLNVRPHQCDQCDRAYVNSWSLRDHKRLIHEGYKRPRKHPCTLCDKVFDRQYILKCHMRTHTGERPYQCSECPAQFTQAGVLRTHVKLIHLKLTRGGRPKKNSGRSRASM